MIFLRLLKTTSDGTSIEYLAALALATPPLASPRHWPSGAAVQKLLPVKYADSSSALTKTQIICERHYLRARPSWGVVFYIHASKHIAKQTEMQPDSAE